MLTDIDAANETAFDALGDASRRRLLEVLSEGPRPVGDLVARMPLSQPAVSQHLRVLREAGLVEVRAEGNRRLYSIRSKGLEKAREYLDRYWDVALDSYARKAEQRAGTDRRSGSKRKKER